MQRVFAINWKDDWSIASGAYSLGTRVFYSDLQSLVRNAAEALPRGSVNRLHLLDHGNGAGDGTIPHLETRMKPLRQHGHNVYDANGIVVRQAKVERLGAVGTVDFGTDLVQVSCFDSYKPYLEQLRPLFQPSGRLILHNCLCGGDGLLIVKIAQAVGVPVVASNQLVNIMNGFTGGVTQAGRSTLTTGFPNGKFSTGSSGVHNMFLQ